MSRLSSKEISIIAAEVKEDYLDAVTEVRRVGKQLDEASKRRALIILKWSIGQYVRVLRANSYALRDRVGKIGKIVGRGIERGEAGYTLSFVDCSDTCLIWQEQLEFVSSDVGKTFEVVER